jgi:hypothetical protein
MNAVLGANQMTNKWDEFWRGLAIGMVAFSITFVLLRWFAP